MRAPEVEYPYIKMFVVLVEFKMHRISPTSSHRNVLSPKLTDQFVDEAYLSGLFSLMLRSTL